MTTAAEAPVIRLNDNMSDLSAVETGSADQSIIGHDTAADTGAHRQIDKIMASPARAEKPFGKCGAIRIILETPFDLKLIFKIGLNRHIAPVHIVGRGGQDSIGDVRRSRRGNAEPLDVTHFQPGIGDKPAPFFSHLRKNIFRISILVFDSVLAQNFSVRGSQTDSKFGSADVISQYDFIFSHDSLILRKLKIFINHEI